MMDIARKLRMLLTIPGDRVVILGRDEAAKIMAFVDAFDHYQFGKDIDPMAAYAHLIDSRELLGDMK